MSDSLSDSLSDSQSACISIPKVCLQQLEDLFNLLLPAIRIGPPKKRPYFKKKKTPNN